MNIREYNFKSATGVCQIYGNVYTPDNDDVKLVLVIHHGMAEHQERYKDFIEFLTTNGVAVFMSDMANHGKSNQNFAETGYFGKKDGYKGIVRDFKSTFDMAKLEYPDKDIVVMGHSMGSFVVRCFTAWYPNEGFSGAIYMGTGGANPIAGVGDKLSSLVAKTTGYTKKSKLLDKMTFGSYGSKFEKRTDFDWLTRDAVVVDEYIADKYCGFLFSAQGMNDLVKLNISANSDEWYSNIPSDTPILLISGAMDPVGEYSKGINQVADKLKQTGHTNVSVKLYPDCRHEVLNELNKSEVYNDILTWLTTKNI
jgi:alpha-beta hydrolase superfamily lysophospholipase